MVLTGGAGKGSEVAHMNTLMVRSVPAGNFEEISAQMPEWKATFLSLVQQGKRIHYDVQTMPAITKDIRTELNKGNYFDFVLERNPDHHFLIPNAN
jgi:putative heme iron utilization protein